MPSLKVLMRFVIVGSRELYMLFFLFLVLFFELMFSCIVGFVNIWVALIGGLLMVVYFTLQSEKKFTTYV